MKKAITFLLIGMLIGTILGSFLFREVKAGAYDEVYYLKKIYNILRNIESDVSGIGSDVDWIEYYVSSM